MYACSLKKNQPGNILITVTIIKKNFTQLQHIHVTFDKMRHVFWMYQTYVK